MKRWWVSLIFCLVGCQSSDNYAPVVNANRLPTHTVVTPLSETTKVTPVMMPRPHHHHTTIKKRVVVPAPSQPVIKEAPVVAHVTPVAPPAAAPITLQLPAQGVVIQKFSKTNPGINIQGTVGEPVHALLPGKVIYSQSGLPDYGNLLIISHDNGLLTAYAHNQVILVAVGDRVTAGEVVAKMGEGANKTGFLHFEVRRAGKPINPIKFLSKLS